MQNITDNSCLKTWLGLDIRVEMRNTDAGADSKSPRKGLRSERCRLPTINKNKVTSTNFLANSGYFHEISF